MAYLERVINCNLPRLSRLLRILHFHAHDLNLQPSLTVYKRHGKGPRQHLRFSKTGDPNSKPPTRPTSSDWASDVLFESKQSNAATNPGVAYGPRLRRQHLEGVAGMWRLTTATST